MLHLYKQNHKNVEFRKKKSFSNTKQTKGIFLNPQKVFSIRLQSQSLDKLQNKIKSWTTCITQHKQLCIGVVVTPTTPQQMGCGCCFVVVDDGWQIGTNPVNLLTPVSSFKCVVVVVAINSEVEIDSRVSMEIGCKDHLASWYIYKCVNLESRIYTQFLQYISQVV